MKLNELLEKIVVAKKDGKKGQFFTLILFVEKGEKEYRAGDGEVDQMYSNYHREAFISVKLGDPVRTMFEEE